ncbi:hypothetical protein HBB16_07340 [Pseudonocardia sp. MCCB 268]|nr:hypothetical protein [Pseudonocardia cytotoxica]
MISVFDRPPDRVRLRPSGRAHRAAARAAPRFRQKVRTCPGTWPRPVWVDDPEFDIAYHVRRSALPWPGQRGSS